MENLVLRGFPRFLTRILIDHRVFPRTRRLPGNILQRGFASSMHVTQEGPDGCLITVLSKQSSQADTSPAFSII